MKLTEIIEAARAANPAAFGKTNDKRAIKILRASLRQLRKQLKSTPEGEVVVNGLGRFAIKNVEREKDGVKVKRRRVILRQGGRRRPAAANSKN